MGKKTAKTKQKRRKTIEVIGDPPEPVVVPELTDINIGGVPGELNVNFCTNHLCEHFGLDAASGLKAGVYTFSKLRSDWNWHLNCKACGQTRHMFNNAAADSVFSYVLKRHLPHEHCTQSDCSNYRINVYEHIVSRKAAARARKQKNVKRARGGYEIRGRDVKRAIYQVRCKGQRNGKTCGHSFQIGKAFGLHTGTKYKSRYLKDYGLFVRTVCNDNGPSSVRDILQCSGNNYYSHLRNLAAVSTGISGYHFSKLLRPEIALQQAHMRLFSDIIEVPLHVGGKEMRAATVKYMVTVTDYNESYCVLAATPLFYPDDNNHTLRKYLINHCQPELKLAECFRKHAYLYRPGKSLSRMKGKDKSKAGKTTYAPKGLDGYLITESYALLGHFLFLRKLLDRVGIITHHFDGERTLRGPAIIAFSDRIKEERCEIVVASYYKDTKYKKKPKKNRKEARWTLQDTFRGQEDVAIHSDESLRRVDLITNGIPAVREEIEKSIQEREEKQDIKVAGKAKKQKGDTAEETEVVEEVEDTEVTQKADEADGAEATEGAEGAEGADDSATTSRKKDFWVDDPIWPKHERERRYLWLTRRKERSIEYEADLYMTATLQPIDMCFAAFRHTTSTVKRAANLPSQGNKRGYGSHAWKPINIINEVVLRTFYWNFAVRFDDESNKDEARARTLGIYDERTIDINKTLPNFRRNTFKRAEEIKQWLGN